MILLVLTGLLLGTALVLNYYQPQMAAGFKWPSVEKKTEVIDVQAHNLDELLEDIDEKSYHVRVPSLFALDYWGLRNLLKKWNHTYLGPILSKLRHERVEDDLQIRALKKDSIAKLSGLQDGVNYMRYSATQLNDLVDHYERNRLNS